VVSGPANVWPREWQRAWRACFAGDERLMAIYRSAFESFGAACRFSSNGKSVKKSVACMKHALALDGVISEDRVADGTQRLNDEEREEFARRYLKLKRELAESTDSIWLSRAG
jgi:dihydrodipicolinate synthase/N-acetylneuraminate lyase